MHYISHRGNLTGPNQKLENNPQYLLEAVKQGYDIEFDVWAITSDDIFLGHDGPQYKVNESFFEEVRGFEWCHAKHLNALSFLLKLGMHCFYHQMDEYTLTSCGYIWSYPTSIIVETSANIIYNQPELNKINKPLIHLLPHISGVCSDNISDIKGIQQ